MPWWWWSLPSQSIWEAWNEFYVQCLPEEVNAPSLLHNKRQPYQICCIMRKSKMLQKNSKKKSYIAMTLMKTPWYNMKTIRASWGPPAKTLQLKTPSCRQDNDPKKRYRSHTIFRMLGSKRFSNHHRRTPDAKQIHKISTKKSSIIQIQELKTPYKWEALSFK